MADRKYFVFCEDNCKFESMTKEQIIAAIVEATGNAPTDIDSAFITKIKEQNKNKDTKFWTGTRSEYNAIVASGAKDPYTIYIVSTDGGFLVDIDAIDGYSKKEIDGFLEDKTDKTEVEEMLSDRAIIQTGTYKGTGTYGTSNKNSLTFNSLPKFVIIFGVGGSWSHLLFATPSYGVALYTKGSSSSNGGYSNVTWSGKTMTWYSASSAANQMNETDVEYTYFAIS